MHTRFLQMIRKLEVNIVAYDYSGYGASSGEPLESSFYLDIEAAYEWTCKKVTKNPQEELVLYGQSIGSGPSVYLATSDMENPYEEKGEEKRAYKGVELARSEEKDEDEEKKEEEGQEVDLSTHLPHRRPSLEGQKPCCAALILHSPLTSGLRVLTDNRCLGAFDIFPNIDRIPFVRVPTFILHGRQDVEVPFHHGLTLYDEIPLPFQWFVFFFHSLFIFSHFTSGNRTGSKGEDIMTSSTAKGTRRSITED